MRELYMKQRVFSISGKFTVKDADEQDAYRIEGSLARIPKRFIIWNKEGMEVAKVIKNITFLFPKFTVEVDGQEIIQIKKKYSFFKSRYTIDAYGLEIKGNWQDMNFTVYRERELVGEVRKKWISWGDSYQINVIDDSLETLLLALVVAIDCVKEDESAAAVTNTF